MNSAAALLGRLSSRREQVGPGRLVGRGGAWRLAEVALLVGQEHIPKAPIAAGLLQQRQGLQHVERILLAGEQGAKALVFGGQFGRQRVVGLDGLLAGLDFGEQRLLPADERHFVPGAERQKQQAEHRQPEAGEFQPLEPSRFCQAAR